MAKLRLHTAESIQTFAKKSLIVAGKPDESELIARVAMPANDKRRMPKGGEPLSAEQIALLRQWVIEGASFTSAVAGDNKDANIGAAPAATPPVAVNAETKVEVKLVDPYEDLKGTAPASQAALQKLTDAGASVQPLFQGNSLLSVSFARRTPPAGDAELAMLVGAAEQIVDLNLAGAQPTAAGWLSLASLKNLSRLHAEHSSIDDAALTKLAALGRVEYLNLFNTSVTDAGVATLKSAAKLRRLYLWQTKASFEAAQSLEAAVPGLVVDLGWDHPAVVKQRAEKELKEVEASAVETGKRLESLQQQLEAAKKDKESVDARLKELQEQLKPPSEKPPSEQKPSEAKPSEKK